jgi:hypothetical protein
MSICTPSLWGQHFTYDAFGNITKQVLSGYTGVSWMPPYNGPANNNPANNQYVEGWNGVEYDANGNLLNDTFNTYTWNGLSVASVNGETITNDTLGRMVENHNGANQSVYPPMGGPSVALMNGQNLDVATIPLVPWGNRGLAHPFAIPKMGLPHPCRAFFATGWAMSID